MVSFWPWKGDDSSPASFEKALSTLSTRISKTTTKLDTLRQRSRRFTLLWTLYAGFAYLLCTVILVLVVGWRTWGLVEYAVVVGGPVIIYAVRLALSTFYDYRTSTIQAQLDELQKQRDATIEKLKTATKYNSTQELLKKYGSTPTPKTKPADGSNGKPNPKQETAKKGPRTSLPPPPTANIPRRDTLPPSYASPQSPTPQSQSTQRQASFHSPASTSHYPPSLLSPSNTSAEFAPNAFPTAPQYAPSHENSRWYDRIMDVLLGEDETRPGARLALICSRCRLVNGQAPPGVKRLEDLGKWRCGGCGTMNGEESEVNKIVSNLQKASQERNLGIEKASGQDTSRIDKEEEDDTFYAVENDHESNVTQYSSDDSDGGRKAKETTENNGGNSTPSPKPGGPRRRSTRSTKGKKPG